MKRQVDWLVNGSLTGPIFSRALNQLTQLEIFPARDKDWPVNERKRLISPSDPIEPCACAAYFTTKRLSSAQRIHSVLSLS